MTWCSSTNSIREIVKEKHIFRHERRYRLNAASYLLSKFTLLGGIGVIQAWTMQMITGLDTTFLTVAATVALIALTGTAIGLTRMLHRVRRTEKTLNNAPNNHDYNARKSICV